VIDDANIVPNRTVPHRWSMPVLGVDTGKRVLAELSHRRALSTLWVPLAPGASLLCNAVSASPAAREGPVTTIADRARSGLVFMTMLRPTSCSSFDYNSLWHKHNSKVHDYSEARSAIISSNAILCTMMWRPRSEK
jgi:hypothetical protein